MSTKFEHVYAKWAADFCRAEGYNIKVPNLQGRLPKWTRINVHRALQSGLCLPQSDGRFRMSMQPDKGPYSWFHRRKREREIGSPCWEYFPQVAAVAELHLDHQLPAENLRIEYGLADVAAVVCEEVRVMIEVKEYTKGIHKLVKAMTSEYAQDVPMEAPDRHNDPLRKSKYIMRMKPQFVLFYSGEGLVSSHDITIQGSGFSMSEISTPDLLGALA